MGLRAVGRNILQIVEKGSRHPARSSESLDITAQEVLKAGIEEQMQEDIVKSLRKEGLTHF
jgi:hypothetical protein